MWKMLKWHHESNDVPPLHKPMLKQTKRAKDFVCERNVITPSFIIIKVRLEIKFIVIVGGLAEGFRIKHNLLAPQHLRRSWWNLKNFFLLFSFNVRYINCVASRHLTSFHIHVYLSTLKLCFYADVKSLLVSTIWGNLRGEGKRLQSTLIKGENFVIRFRFREATEPCWRIITLWLSHALKFNLCLKAHESGFPTFPASSTLPSTALFNFRLPILMLNILGFKSYCWTSEHQDRRSDIHNWNDLQFYISVFTVSADTKRSESETDEKLCKNYLVNLVPVKFNWFSPSAVHAKIYVHRSNRFQFRSFFSSGRGAKGTWLKS